MTKHDVTRTILNHVSCNSLIITQSFQRENKNLRGSRFGKCHLKELDGEVQLTFLFDEGVGDELVILSRTFVGDE